MEIRKAIIPVAGLGTRLLPATKALPKEMMPLGRKPVVQHIIEELSDAGLTDLLFVTRRGKELIEDHFSADPELFRHLERKGDAETLAQVQFEGMRGKLYAIRQQHPRGLGDAILCARGFVGDEDFVVANGDSVLGGGEGGTENSAPLLRRMAALRSERGAAAVIAAERMPRHELSRYGVIVPAGSADGRVVKVRDLVEKPRPENAPSDLAIAARYVFTPEILEALEERGRAGGEEISLPEAITSLIQKGRDVYAMVLPEGVRRYDIGNFESYYRAFLDFALRDEEFGNDLRARLKDL